MSIERWITLSDPDRHLPFAIVDESARERLLTGGDFDIESVRADRDGDLWFGDGADRHGRAAREPHRSIHFDGTKAGPGHDVVSGAALGVAGDSTVEIVARVSAFDAHRASVKVPIE